MEFNPTKIYEDFQKNRLDKLSAAELLFSLIENSESDNIRVESIKELEKLCLIDEKTYKSLENLLISDSSERVRNAAALTLKNLFLDKALEPMVWALLHEESPACLKNIYDTIIIIIRSMQKKMDSMTRLLLFSEIKKLKNLEIKIGFDIICEQRGIEDLDNSELVNILINAFTLVLLEKTYWRLKVKIEGCKVIELDFIFKGLTTFPEAIMNLTSIKTLVLRYNQIFTIPDWIGQLTSLEELNLNVNNIKSLPSSIGALKSLKVLALWKNELSELPSSIGLLSALKYLNLRINNLKNLPESIGNLGSLKELNLHDNKLVELPTSIGRLFSLQKLNLSWNNLIALPNTIGLMKSLKVLDLERNELLNIPISIGSLKSLEILNLSDNKLETLPDTISSLSSLQILNISRNNLKTLPPSILSLKLKELYIGDNKFNNISDLLVKLEEYGVRVYY